MTRRADDAAPAAACTVSVADPAMLDARILADWDSLSREAEHPNPFFAPWFLRPAIRWLDPEGAVRLLLIHGGDGALIGLMPVVPGATYAGLPVRNQSIWKNNHLYVGTPLIRSGTAMCAMAALLDWIGTGPHGDSFLRLTQFPAEGPVFRALTTLCAGRGRETFIRRRQLHAVLHRGHDFDTLFDAAHSTRQRAELRRRFRRFDEGGAVTVDETTLSPAAALPLAEAFMRLENDGWKGASETGFALAKSQAEAAFFRDVLRRGAAQGRILSTVVARDGAPVAISIALRGGDRSFGFKTAFDRAHAKSSPGVRVFHETTRRMLADPGCALYDSCAMPDHPLVDRLWPDRAETVEIDIPAAGRTPARVLRLATRMATTKKRIARAWGEAESAGPRPGGARPAPVTPAPWPSRRGSRA